MSWRLRFVLRAWFADAVDAGGRDAEVVCATAAKWASMVALVVGVVVCFFC